MSSQKHKSFRLLTIFFDIFAVSSSFFAAYFLRFRYEIVPLSGKPPSFFDYGQTLIVIVPIYLWFFRAYGLYDPRRHVRRVEQIFQAIKAITFAVVILMALTFFYRSKTFSRVYLVTLWFVSILLVGLTRYLLIQWEYHLRYARKEITRVLLVGANRNTRQIIQWARDNKHYGREIIGVLVTDSSLAGKHLEGAPILGTEAQCESFIDQIHPEEVILLDTSFDRHRITNIVALCEDRSIEFKIGADIYGLLTRNVDVEYISTVPLLGFRVLPLDDIWNRAVKRTFDVILSALIMVLTFPLWLLVMALVKLSDGGPVFYKQERMGRDQKLFNVLKFRTMPVNAEKETGPVWAAPNDQRRTQIGAFLRRWNLDELPQLFNVLVGNMSLVGPRPERPHFIKQFRGELPRYMARHKIKSGLTGWAQVNGYRGNTSIEERLKYDLYYLENWSLVFDVEILFMTFFAFKNAY